MTIGHVSTIIDAASALAPMALAGILALGIRWAAR